MLSVLGFLIILGPLVVVHEFGHYIFARIFGVKAEVFSIGFGPRLWSKQLGETELRLSAVPIGGYVKLLGEDPTTEMSAAEQKRALHRQKAWKRFFIFFGGPLFNFLFAIVIFMAILAIGEPQPGNVIGRVVAHSAAERAGFQSGDKVLAVDEKPIRLFEDLIDEISDHPDQALHFKVLHPEASTPVVLEAKPAIQSGFSVYGETTNVGEIDGIIPAARSTITGISDPRSTAAKAGFKTGDELTTVNAQPIKSWEELEALYKKAPLNALFHIKATRGDSKAGIEADLVKTSALPEATPGSDWGLYSTELFVDKAVPSSPAQVAGVMSGDRLIGVGKQNVYSFVELRDAVQRAGESVGHVDLRWERAGKPFSASIVPTATTSRDPLLKKVTQYTVGVVPLLTMVDPVLVTDRILNPFMLVIKATERMVIFTWRNFVSIGKMFTGDVSVKSLGGPIMIGKIAGESLAHGLVSFLTTMAILSIGLGVLNVLPIPVLDGGHLLLLAIESVRGKAMTMKQMEIIQGVGLSLILLLMAVVMRNDILRLPFF
jgi:regulator of sigma E protease